MRESHRDDIGRRGGHERDDHAARVVPSDPSSSNGAAGGRRARAIPSARGAVAAWALLLALTPPASAQPESADETRAPAVPDWVAGDSRAKQNLRWTVDIASRMSHDAPATGLAQFFGLDSRKVFSGRSGDWGTLLVQVYVSQALPLPGSSGQSTWKISPRFVSFRYTGVSQGRITFRGGHFELPFGLEVPINTNGTLRQLGIVQNLGIKGAWGVGVGGALGAIDYEASWTEAGSKLSELPGRPQAFTARIGTDQDRWVAIGASVFRSLAHTPAGIRNRRRAALDTRWLLGPLELSGEFTVGTDDSTPMRRVFVDVNWRSRDDSMSLYAQSSSQRLLGVIDRGVRSWVLGARHTIGPHWALSTQYTTTNGTALAGADFAPRRSSRLAVQARYRF